MPQGLVSLFEQTLKKNQLERQTGDREGRARAWDLRATAIYISRPITSLLECSQSNRVARDRDSGRPRASNDALSYCDGTGTGCIDVFSLN